MKAYLRDTIFRGWSEPNWLTWLLLPLTGFYQLVMLLRHFAYRIGVFSSYRADVPVIVVGNISVGGTGKTPLTMALLELLEQRQLKVGVVSRGYGGQALEWPQTVTADSNPHYVGDEPLLIARRMQCPVVVGPNRGRAIDLLNKHSQCDVIIADDGLQHYALQRDIEIAIVDTQRRHLNQFCLPAGPLREPTSRLKNVDLVIHHISPTEPQSEDQQQAAMWLESCPLQAMRGDKSLPEGSAVHAVAGIGHPQRFFRHLRQLGYDVIEHPFPDHYQFSSADFSFNDQLPIIMTEKDAVKCDALADDRFFYLPVKARLNQHAEQQLSGLFERVLAKTS